MKNLFNENIYKVSESKIKELGQFYTKKKTSKDCVDFFLKVFKKIDKNLDNYIFIEPSAGYGCFINNIIDRNLPVKAYDIEPKHKLAKKKDFLKEKIVIKGGKKKIIIGNPPFGKRSKTAIGFFNKSSEYSDIIAFIVPNQFTKYSVQSKLNKEYKLVKEFKLKKNSFYTELKKDYNVNCVFQIWTKLDTTFKDLRIKNPPKIKHNDFDMYQYNNTVSALKVFNNNFDFAVFSQGYGDYQSFVFDKDKMDKKKQWLLFKAKNNTVLKRLKGLDFEKLSKENTTIPGFRKNNIIKEYTRLWG